MSLDKLIDYARWRWLEALRSNLAGDSVYWQGYKEGLEKYQEELSSEETPILSVVSDPTEPSSDYSYRRSYNGKDYIVHGSFTKLANAEKLVEILKSKGIKATITERIDVDIDSIPSANVVERKRGEWKKLEYTKIYTGFDDDDDLVSWKDYPVICTRCGYDLTERNEQPNNFCPNCGADMRGEKHG